MLHGYRAVRRQQPQLLFPRVVKSLQPKTDPMHGNESAHTRKVCGRPCTAGRKSAAFHPTVVGKFPFTRRNRELARPVCGTGHLIFESGR